MAPTAPSVAPSQPAPVTELYAKWDQQQAERSTNPICIDCGKPNLFHPKSIELGVCASCVKTQEQVVA
jgi:hypothetical protein